MALTAVPAEAQVKIGLRAGADMTDFSFSKSNFKSSNRAGFFFGPQVKLTVPIVGLSFDASALYDNHDIKVEGENLTQQSIIVPIHLRYGVGFGEFIGIFAAAGPQFDFNIGDKDICYRAKDDDDSRFSVKDSRVSWDFGVGFYVGSHFEAAAYYNVPLGRSGQMVWRDGSDVFVGKAKEKTWRVGITYYF